MGQSKDLARVYRIIKMVAQDIDPFGKSREEIISSIRSGLRNNLTYVRAIRSYTHSSFSVRGFKSGTDKKFVQSKYTKIGLPSREKIMVNKMIDTVVDEMDYDDSFSALQRSLDKAEVCNRQAKAVADETDVLIGELDSISNFLETGEWV